MDTINNFFGSIFTNLDKGVTTTLDNKYLFITVVVVTLLIGSLTQSRLSHNILSLYDTPLSRMLMIGFIYYISQKNVPLAILMVTATVVLMNTQNRQRFNIMLISLFRKSLYDRKHRMIDSAISQAKLDRLIRKIGRVLKDMKKKKTKKVPKELTKMALKAKSIAKSLGQSTPKIVKDLVPSNIIDKLLNEKKISKDDADKLKTIKSNTLLELVRMPEILKMSESSPKSVIKTEVVTPKVVTSEKFEAF